MPVEQESGPTTPAAEPEMYITARYRCVFCGRSGSRKRAVAEHMTRCWYNPAVRSCKTCAHYIPARGSEDDLGHDEECAEGIVFPHFTDRPRSLPVGFSHWQRRTVTQ